MAETFGESYIETARDKIVALLTALQTTMATSYDPTFDAVHEKHTVARLLYGTITTAVTVDLESFDQTDAEQESTALHTGFMIDFSIRVHTDYSDKYSDGQKQARLLNSITNKLKTNYNLGDNYHLYGVSEAIVNKTFDQTDTVGGEITATVFVVIEHTQE